MIVLALITLLLASAAGVEVDSCAESEPEHGQSLLQAGREARRHVVVEEKEPHFKVLFLGAPRTGTQTMDIALKKLGLNPVHSGSQRYVRAPWCNFLFGNGSFEVALQTMTGFDTAMDEPFHLIYEGVLHRFPDCKFILPVFKPEEWYSSCLRFQANHRAPNQFLPDMTPAVSEACQDLHYFDCDFTAEQTPELKERCLAGYRRHHEHVQQVVPAKQLLIFNPSDGYGPLAKFLDKPVPDEPFPYYDKFNPTHRQSSVTTYGDIGGHA